MNINKQLSSFFNNLNVMDADLNERDNFQVRDYKSLNKNDIINNTKDEMTAIYKLMEDEFIENAMYNLYKDINLWDFILILNNRDALIDMPYNSNKISEFADELIKNYFNNPQKPYQGNAPDFLQESYKEYLIDKLNRKNVEFSKLKVIKPEYLGKILREIKYK